MPAAARRSVSDSLAVRILAEQAFSRAAGAPLLAGNAVELLIDARANFDAWLAAIRAARTMILIENYIFRDDAIGRAFLDALTERAAAGVRVCVIRDWLGCIGQSSAAFWHPLGPAGGEMRTYNPMRFTNPVGWLSRDHRKLLVVDDTVAFVGGICVSGTWLGDPERGLEPWRDTAIAVRGPARRDLVHAFADTWATLGEPLPDDLAAESERCLPAGHVDLRVVATVPNTAGLYRLDQLIAAMARRTLWITDAYFVGVAPYVQALSAAARDGVDVRLLVPGTSDIPAVAAISRVGYRPLLEAGVRVFEWNGSMLHAKTAVADSRWARVGSSNLNLSSWIGNCELDVAVEDETFARAMEAQYETDLGHATEIVLKLPRRQRKPNSGVQAPESDGAADAPPPDRSGSTPGPAGSVPGADEIPPRASEPSPRTSESSFRTSEPSSRPTERPESARRGPPYPRARGGSSGRAAAGAMRIANSVGAAIANRRVLGRSETSLLAIGGGVLFACAIVGFFWPRVIAWPLAVLALWIGVSLFVQCIDTKPKKPPPPTT
ncbi:MAG TPA: phospholipase D-like domain-containing protein [Rhodanobacteraceae bacterium]|nr:phospholipase D-like domain-containing protein [Rhodanobacteraceae bacterium]